MCCVRQACGLQKMKNHARAPACDKAMPRFVSRRSLTQQNSVCTCPTAHEPQGTHCLESKVVVPSHLPPPQSQLQRTSYAWHGCCTAARGCVPAKRVLAERALARAPDALSVLLLEARDALALQVIVVGARLPAGRAVACRGVRKTRAVARAAGQDVLAGVAGRAPAK